MTASKKGAALVTGASSGIGAVYADRLAKRGYDLILVARNRDRLARLADRLETETGRLVEIIAADLADEEDVARVETPLRTDPRITLLLNNAGVGAAASLLEAEIEKMDRDDPPERQRADSTYLRCRAELRREGWWGDHQHRLDRSDLAGEI
jgi:uncharacterized protein